MGVRGAQLDGGVQRSPELLAQDTQGMNGAGANKGQRSRRGNSTAQVDLGATGCAILVGAAVCRLRRPVLKWWRQNGGMIAGQGSKPVRMIHKGPHLVPARVRAGTGGYRTKAMR